MRKLLLLMLVPATALAGCAARPGQGRSPDASE